MPRDGAHARDRLVAAALELYSEHGYDQTTAADIAARADVTARTFFRHFADKREVLFHTEADLRDEMARSLAAVPADTAPPAAVLEAFRAMGPGFEANREHARTRHAIIIETPALQEREMAKSAALADVVADGLRARGVEGWEAALIARTSTAALGQVFHTWATDPSTDFDTLIVRVFEGLRIFGDAGNGSEAP